MVWPIKNACLVVRNHSRGQAVTCQRTSGNPRFNPPQSGSQDAPAVQKGPIQASRGLLDTPPNLTPEAIKDNVGRETQEGVLAKAQVVGRYRRLNQVI